jgi:hypothetical protein
LIRALALAILMSAYAPVLAWGQPVPDRWPDALTVDEFRADLLRIAGQIRSITTAADARALSATLPGRWRVNVGDGERLELSTRWLTSALDTAAASDAAWPDAREALSRRLERMRDEVVPRVTGDAEARVRARTSVQAILSNGEFQQTAMSRWREDLRERVTRWVEGLFNRFGITGQTGERAVKVLAWVIGLLALIGLGVWLAGLMGRQPRHLIDLGSTRTERPRAHDLAVRALALARAGDVREAVRVAYHASLIRLEEQGCWRIDEARTPREYVRLVAATDARHAPLVDMTRRFEQIWYGNRTAGDDDAASVASDLEVLGCLRPGERAI